MKKLLVLTSRYPYPVTQGDRLRIHNICSALAERFDITLASLCERPEDLHHDPGPHPFTAVHRVYLPKRQSYLNVLRSLPGSTPLQLAYFQSSTFRHLVARLIPEHDLVIAHLIRAAQFVPSASEAPRILEMTDAISMNYGRMKTLSGVPLWRKLLYNVEEQRVARYEAEVIQRFDRTWLVSAVDAARLPASTGTVEVIPNGVHRYRLPQLNGGCGNTIAFIGNMGYAQNQDGCLHFARNILPRIRERADISFRVIGNCPKALRDRLLRFPGVQVTGRFDSLEPHVLDVFCGICSVRAGAGIQNKILEYLAMGLPCVSTPVGAEGIAAANEILIYRSDQEAARLVLALHQDSTLRRKMAQAGRELVSSQYDWERLYQRFKQSAAEVLQADSALPKAV